MSWNVINHFEAYYYHLLLYFLEELIIYRFYVKFGEDNSEFQIVATIVIANL
jgi:hypothetical protein